MYTFDKKPVIHEDDNAFNTRTWVRFDLDYGDFSFKVEISSYNDEREVKIRPINPPSWIDKNPVTIPKYANYMRLAKSIDEAISNYN